MIENSRRVRRSNSNIKSKKPTKEEANISFLSNIAVLSYIGILSIGFLGYIMKSKILSYSPSDLVSIYSNSNKLNIWFIQNINQIDKTLSLVLEVIAIVVCVTTLFYILKRSSSVIFSKESKGYLAMVLINAIFLVVTIVTLQLFLIN